MTTLSEIGMAMELVMLFFHFRF